MLLINIKNTNCLFQFFNAYLIFYSIIIFYKKFQIGEYYINFT